MFVHIEYRLLTAVPVTRRNNRLQQKTTRKRCEKRISQTPPRVLDGGWKNKDKKKKRENEREKRKKGWAQLIEADHSVDAGWVPL